VIGSTRQVSVYAYGGPVDMRRSYDGLSALVERELHRNPLSGDLYLFVNRSRRMAKVLLWDGTGLCVYSKRLESGQFASPWREAEEPCLRLTMSELQLFLEGSTWVGKVVLSPPVFVPKSLALRHEMYSNRHL
jgi:transposase